MKLVIWGLGFRGKMIADCLKSKYVAAIIESDKSKIGQVYNGIEVISFDRYMEKHKILPIIITPEYQFQIEISQQLTEKNILHFTFGYELPSNIRYNGKLGLECYLDMIDESATIYLYGINAFSIVLYLFLVENGKNIKFIIENDNIKATQGALIELMQLDVVNTNVAESINEPLYITTYERIIDIGKKFSGYKVIDAFRYAESREEYWNIEVEKLHNKYLDRRRCFIVATGPSLTMADLDTLVHNQEFCFSVNSICKIETSWKPDVYVVLDGKFFSENIETIRNYKCPIKIFTDDNINLEQQKKEGEYRLHRGTIGTHGLTEMEFSEDITKIINSQGTVITGCIQIAVYMGFREIYLLGTDCNYEMGSFNNHFGGDSTPDLIDHSISEMVRGYQVCKDYADAHNIKIYNATRGGMLEVFERVDFDSLFD